MPNPYRNLFLCLWLLTLALMSGLLWFITLIPSYPAQDHDDADAIVVLTGGPLRLEHGFTLLMEGRAQKMFISGAENGVTLPVLLRKKEWRAFAGRILADRVTFGYRARSTMGN